MPQWVATSTTLQDGPHVISFHLSCVPPRTNHQRKRIVTIRTKAKGTFSRLADSDELNDAKAMLDSLLLPHQPPEPITGPVALRLAFTWPWLKSHGKRLRAQYPAIPHTSKPDCSNIAKTLEDRLVALRFIEDDRHVVMLIVSKEWGDDPGIRVTIQPYALTSLDRRSVLYEHLQGRNAETG